MINKNQVVRRFGRSSTSYDEHAVVQKHMAATLQALLHKTGVFNRILEIGCGTGGLTKMLAALYPQASILATDISPDMLAAAQDNLSDFTNIRYAVEDGEQLQTRETFDLIVSNATFQWFNNHRQSYTGFFKRLSANGCLAYATFGPQTFYELHQSFATANHLLNSQCDIRHGQHFPAALKLQRSMEDAGFQDVLCTEEELREYFPTVKDFLRSVKKVGANNTNYDGSISRQLMFTMMGYYEQNFKEHDHIHATYHTIYALGRKSVNINR